MLLDADVYRDRYQSLVRRVSTMLTPPSKPKEVVEGTDPAKEAADEDESSSSSDLAEYIVVHELLHLKFPDHRQGWQVSMGMYLSDWRERERRLAGYVVAMS